MEDVMGRTRLIKKLKSKGIILLIAGIIISLISTLMSVAFIIDGPNPILIAFIIMLICGIIFIYNGVDYLKKENSKFIKKHPEILELADDLDINKVYEDNFIIISNKAISPKKDITKVAALDDVLGIYESIQRTNGIVTSHIIRLELRDGRCVTINVYAKKRETKDNLVLTISNYCHNAKVGYSNETLSYIKEQRKEYKEKRN